MEIKLEADILPEKSWFALGRISLFLRSTYPFPDVSTGAYGYEQDRESEIIQDLFLVDLIELHSYLSQSPNLNSKDKQRLIETFLLNLNISSKSISLDHQKYIADLQSLLLCNFS